MKLHTIKRDTTRKGETKRLRREGRVPVVLYHKGKEGSSLSIELAAYEAIVRQVKPGHLATQRITLVDEAGKENQAVLKEIQYHPTTYKVLHLDFEQLDEDVPVNVKVPIECTGVIDCAGIKLGGVLRQVIRSLKVRCLPKDIPAFLTLDVQALGIKDAKRLSDLAIPETVRPLVNLNEVAVVIAKR